MTGFTVTTVFMLFCTSALAGLATGFLLFKARAIILASFLVALLTAAFLFHHGFGLVRDVLTMVGSLTALQSFYLAGAAVRYLTMDEQNRWRSGSARSGESAAAPVAPRDRLRDPPELAPLLWNHCRSRRQPHGNIGEHDE